MVLREALRNGGSVTYHFVREEIVRISGESKTIEKESYLKTNLSNLIIFNSKDERNTPDQILQILRDTCSDLGANYFTIQSNT